MLYSNRVNPVALPPGRARLSTNPPPTGSATNANTIGTVRVVCRSGAKVVLPGPRLDGASLTVMQLRPDGFDVSLVYHTQQTITLPQKRPGALVNIEVDVVGKYVERLAECPRNEGITLDLLRRSGFA